MGRLVLPRHLREKIKDLSDEGYSSIEIFDSVLQEASDYINSPEQLTRCIAGLTRSSSGKQTINSSSNIIPQPRHFETTRYTELINSLSETTPGKKFENACLPVALDILTELEGFTGIEDANQTDSFHNPPFDFLGYKDGKLYIIELKSSLNTFNTPGETQKRRLQEILDQIKELNIALLQIKLRDGEYRIFYNEELNVFFDGYQMPLEPVIDWIKQKMVKR